jgi:gas vesicle protein
MARQEEAQTSSGFMPGLLWGLAIGIPVGLLLAPRPGRQTVDMLMDRAEALGDRAGEVLEDVQEMLRVASLKLRGYPHGNAG